MRNGRAKGAEAHQLAPAVEVLVGTFTKRDAAAAIAAGARHLHSTPLGHRDAGVAATEKSLAAGALAPYPWEPRANPSRIWIEHSEQRHAAVESLVKAHSSQLKRDGREKVESVLEELLTNAIYHSYRKDDGTAKYDRRKPVGLEQNERVELLYHGTREGLYIAVRDRSGLFPFSAIEKSFLRCYGAAEGQIEQKDSGAGLGLYMVYEAVTHLRIVNVQGQFCETSCWIAYKRSFDPSTFSFNFFDWR